MTESTPPAARGSLPDLAAGAPRAEVLGPRGFWLVFSAGWLAYWLLAVITIGLEGESPWIAMLGAAVVVSPLVLPAVVLARGRRHLLRPMPSLPRFVAHKVAVGLGYAAAVIVLGGVCQQFVRIEALGELSGDPGQAPIAWFLLSLFLYTIFLVFLLWLDALERVQGTRELAAEEAVLRAGAEAKALRAQFNPHFVFNTLHSLMLLVRSEPDTAERAIEDVAELIRYASTLQRLEVDQVTLGKELAFARRYLALEKLRLADRLDVEWHVDDELTDVLVPAFSLQTLLENAIKHGISPKPEGGTIRVRAALGGQSLTMAVEDDGVGADPRAIRREGGSGLQLLRSRLGNVHGEGASLAWDTGHGGGFQVRLTMPVRRAEGRSARRADGRRRPSPTKAEVPAPSSMPPRE